MLAVLSVTNAGAATLDNEGASSHVVAIADEIIPRDMEEYGVPGTVIVVVDRNGVIYEAGYGYADLAKQTPMDPQTTIVRVASVSKTFTALAALEEVAALILYHWNAVGLHL